MSIPIKQGHYALVPNQPFSSDLPSSIDVYEHPVKGLCVWTSDYGAEPNGHKFSDGHVPVGACGLDFGDLLSEI